MYGDSDRASQQARDLLVGDASSVSDSLVWNVNQAETIGYGVDEMSDEERSSFYQELAANFIDMAADEVEGHPDKYPDVNADEVDLNALRREENKDLRSMVADALSDDRLRRRYPFFQRHEGMRPLRVGDLQALAQRPAGITNDSITEGRGSSLLRPIKNIRRISI